VTFRAFFRSVLAWNSRIFSDSVRGIGSSKSLVIQGCLRAYSAVYRSIGIGLHSFAKKSLASGVKFMAPPSCEVHFAGEHVTSF
jgi:hypothetical protein